MFSLFRSVCVSPLVVCLGLCAMGLLTSASSHADPLSDAATALDEERYDDALAKAKMAHKAAPKKAGPMLLIGRAYFEKEDWAAAEEWLNKATKADPRNADAFMWLGRTHGQKARESNLFVKGLIAPKIRKAFEKAVESRPDNIDSRNDLIQFYVEAPGFLGGSVKKALAQAKAVAALDEKEGLLSYAQVYSSSDQLAKAYETFVKGMNRFPDDESFYFQAGYAAVRLKQWDNAFDAFVALTTKMPERWGGHYQIGRVAALSGKRLGLGEESMKKYLAHTPGDGDPGHEYAGGVHGDQDATDRD